MILRTLLLVAVAAVVSGQFPKPDSAPAGFGGGASQVPFPPKRKPGAPPPFTAPAGSGAGASQVPFPPKGQPGVPPPFTAPAGFGPAESQRPFLDPPRRPPAPPPVPSGDVIPILVDERDGPHPDGSYSFNFETGNGISRYEQGAPQGETGAVASQGGWSFTLPDGTPAVFTFVADEFGYRVESDLLPTPHPLPAHAIAQIEFARQQKASGGGTQYRS
ncbi:endocuticle structural glycoprotein SgAbd-8-like [Homarus americanus]|uniref:endocuticle structural glycoprotein SgAbd-8-like n=1 Tax=Homarus americanus TaxID=6706 RepID=UPI001C4836A0|nr:endocuticle structural glycoprotein SgAbd-8-like [Homarus americanus]